MDHGAWYDYGEKGNPKRELKDLTFIAAMGPPTGGKNAVTSRYLRHFNLVICDNFDETCLERIFTKLMDWHIRRYNIAGTVSARVLKNVVGSSVSVFLYAQAEMKPTPSKSHYLFNLRDLSRVI